MGSGQLTALVGPSGAGKSAVAGLLLRFGQPDRGGIFIGEAALAEVPVDAWRRQVAWVPQRPYLFHDTIAANIRLARPEATLAQVAQAAERAQLHSFVEALPEGYDTPVGELGARLSGGQAQRVALARAFLKDAPILILDEPAASLDADLAAQLETAMRALMQGRSVLLIAHRLSRAWPADQIIVLDQGRVAAAGSFAGLMQPGTRYRHLVEAALGAA